MLRRGFLQALGGAPLLAQPGIVRPIRLGIDTYSLRTFRWKVDKLLDYAESQKLDAMQVSFGDFESFDDPYLKRLKERADRSGIRIEPGFGCICPLSKGWTANRKDTPSEHLLQGIRATKALGGSSFRVFIGNSTDRPSGNDLQAMAEVAVKALHSVRAQAQDSQVRIAIENHGDFRAREMKAIIEDAGRDFVGSCLDAGNPVMIMEDPLLTLEVLAPYVVTTHFRDSVVYEHPRGAAAQWVALGDGSIDLKVFMARFRELCPKATLQLEIITGRPPTVLPYLETGFWKNFAGMPAADFARFVALAKRGHPLMGPMVIADAPGMNTVPEFRNALREQDRFNLDRSLDYARKILDAGIRWRG